MSSHHFSYLLLVALLIFKTAAAAAVGDSKDKCVYNIYVKTGTIFKAGTDSKIGITLSDAAGESLWVPDLKKWGLMDSHHDYFEYDQLDIFSVLGPCNIDSPICFLQLTSDGSGSHHGWFCEYVEVTSTGPHKRCSKTLFYVNQWLAIDAYPYGLTAVIDGCSMLNTTVPKQVKKSGTLVVRNVKKVPISRV